PGSVDGDGGGAGEAWAALPAGAAERIADATMQAAARITHDRLVRAGVGVPTVRQLDRRLIVRVPAGAPSGIARARRIIALEDPERPGGASPVEEHDRAAIRPLGALPAPLAAAGERAFGPGA